MSNDIFDMVASEAQERSDGGAFFCWDLVKNIDRDMDEKGRLVVNGETFVGKESSWDFWHRRFLEAKSGRCRYAKQCARFAGSLKRHPKQREIFFLTD